MTVLDAFVPVVLNKVYKLIEDKIENPRKKIIKVFAQNLLEQLSEDDLRVKNEYDLYGSILSLWHHIEEDKDDSISVKVFNPSVNKHGWKSPHTIVEIVCPDRKFLVESINITLNRLKMSNHLMMHGPYNIERDKHDEIIGACGDKGSLTTVFHIEVDRLESEKELKKLYLEIKHVLKDVNCIVSDWNRMIDKLNLVARSIPSDADIHGSREIKEFLDWVANDNFTLMGYHSFDIIKVDGDIELHPSKEKGLGILSRQNMLRSIKLSELPASALDEARKSKLLILTKANQKSHIHRPAYFDYIGIKRFNNKGEVIGEHRFIGLYGANTYHQTALSIPLIRDKVERILKSSKYPENSHSWKSLLNILESYPRDELIQATEDEMLRVGLGVVQMQDRDLLRLFVRRDPFGRFFSCIIYIRKERYNTDFRNLTQDLFSQYFNSTQDIEFSVTFTEGAFARTHFIVRVEDNNFNINTKLLEHNLMEIASAWEDRLHESLVSHFGETTGIPLSKKYIKSFQRSYKEASMPGAALADIQQLEALDENNPLGMLFYTPQEESSNSNFVKLKLFHKNEQIYLSDVMPMLENLGLRVIGEAPHEVMRADGEVFWILDFSMLHTGCSGNQLKSSKDRFQEALYDIWYGKLENDGFNKLVLCAGLSGRQVTIIRALARYMRQISFPFSLRYMERTLSNYPKLTQLFIKIFDGRFNPNGSLEQSDLHKLYEQFEQQLEEVESLDDDRIFRRYIEVIKAVKRTNFYQTDANHAHKEGLSFKIKSTEITDIPQPAPLFEIYVYSPDIEGVHLRGGKIARGGLRWSDRQEDFRTEVLGLVKAQQVKNSVIVPVGAKGGFICKKQGQLSTRLEILNEAKRCYSIFIRSLLDITDNIINNKLVPPKDVVRHDDDDSYLVVAADKGTATFSDIANSISAEYNFWLGDAFASGGSNGYDHKKMGITAKGAWESVKRHFREINVDCQNQTFTCIGIGDMAGDVFGNGMLLSKYIKLKAAFNHLHIFIDPNPDHEVSWGERNRLFQMNQSSWEDYDNKLISKGGGVFSRKAKSIKLNKEIKKLLNTESDSITPNELIKLILKMNVDLLWNGGIGTYVKSSLESDASVGDRANDALRINGNELNCKIVGEGGNLGLTQLARIEYAKKGGRVNTDFIDNVGGVDTSDNEVNIKVLLNSLILNQDLTFKQRNSLLVDMEEQVLDIVINDSYTQSESISVTEYQGTKLIKEQIRFIQRLEREGKLNRALEYLPDDESLEERNKLGQKLTRPEIAVLIAYGKMILKEELTTNEIFENNFLSNLLISYFPTQISKNYKKEILCHPLKKEIIATCLANEVCNEMGFNFVTRMQDETGATFSEIVCAYITTREIFNFKETFEEIRKLDNQVSANTQYKMLKLSRRMLRRTSRWFLRNTTRKFDIKKQIDFYKPVYDDLLNNLDNYLVKDEIIEHNEMAESFHREGVPIKLAQKISRLTSMYSVLDLAQISQELKVDISLASKVYFVLGAHLSLHWFLNQIVSQPVKNHWQAMARTSFREDLDWQQRQLTVGVIEMMPKEQSIQDAIDAWIQVNSSAVNRWNSVLTEFKFGTVHEFAKFSVALRELMLLSLNCKNINPLNCLRK